MRIIQQGDRVQVHYVKVFQDGSVVSSRGKTPLELTVGVDHRRLPGLGLALVGLAVGERRTVVVPAALAYGRYVPGLVRRLAHTRFLGHQDLSPGKWVRIRSLGHRRLVRIVEMRKSAVVVDANRRWAGQSLELEVEVMTIHGPEVPSGADGEAPRRTLDPECSLREERWLDEGFQE
jgi:peptidylprolyl isomerase